MCMQLVIRYRTRIIGFLKIQINKHHQYIEQQSVSYPCVFFFENNTYKNMMLCNTYHVANLRMSNPLITSGLTFKCLFPLNKSCLVLDR